MSDPIAWSADAWPYFLAAMAGGYLCGSIPFGLLLTRLAGHGDIRAIGSGNIGATNVLRTGNKWLAALTLLLDAAKGALPVIVAWQILGFDAALFAGFGAFVGHLFPVWLGFKGGKGGATGLGVLFGLDWRVGLITMAAWIAVAALTRYSSLATLLASLATPFLAWFLFDNGPLAIFAALFVLLIWYRHAANIRRLARGEESRIGGKKN